MAGSTYVIARDPSQDRFIFCDQVCLCTDMYTQFKDDLEGQLTKKVALEMLKDIQDTSEAVAFFTSDKVLIPVAFLLVGISLLNFFLIGSAEMMICLTIATFALMFFWAGDYFSRSSSLEDALISDIYQQQARNAAECFGKINIPEILYVKLADPAQ